MNIKKVIKDSCEMILGIVILLFICSFIVGAVWFYGYQKQNTIKIFTGKDVSWGEAMLCSFR